MIKGLIYFLRDRHLVNFDEQLYIATRLKASGARWKHMWARWPRLHFCLTGTSDLATQKEVLGCTFRELKEAPSKLDPTKPSTVLLTHDVTRAGAPRVALEIAQHLRKTYNVVFLSLHGGEMQAECAAVATCSFFNLGHTNLSNKIQHIMEHLRLASKPAFVIANSIGSADALEAVHSIGAPIVQLIHEIADIESPHRFEEVARHCAAVVFPAPIVRDRALVKCPHLQSNLCCVIPQGVFLAERRDTTGEEHARHLLRPMGLDPETVIVLGAGSVQFLKGVDLFILCAQAIFRKCPQAKVRFVWAGAGYSEDDQGYSAFLRRQVECAGLSDRVAFTGKIKNLQDLYNSADIFFLSSRFDSLPLVAQDAMAARVPVVCFDGAGGIPDFLRLDPDAAEGIVPYLDVQAAAEKILQLSANRALRTRVADGGFRVAQKYFRKEDYFAALDHLFSQVADMDPRSPQDSCRSQ